MEQWLQLGLMKQALSVIAVDGGDEIAAAVEPLTKKLCFPHCSDLIAEDDLRRKTAKGLQNGLFLRDSFQYMGTAPQVEAAQFSPLVQNRTDHTLVRQDTAVIPEKAGLAAGRRSSQKEAALFHGAILHLLEQGLGAVSMLSGEADIQGSNLPQTALLSLMINSCAAETNPMSTLEGDKALFELLLKTVDGILADREKDFLHLFFCQSFFPETAGDSSLHPERRLSHKEPQLRQMWAKLAWHFPAPQGKPAGKLGHHFSKTLVLFHGFIPFVCPILCCRA